MNSFKAASLVLIVAALNLSVMAQRGSYAGNRPSSGYKDRFRPRANETAAAESDIANRFDNSNPDATQRPPNQAMPVVMGEVPVDLDNRTSGNAEPSSTLAPSTTAETSSRLPFDAHGDEDLVKYLLSLPEDKRPFWLVNYQAIEAHRNSTSNGANLNTASRSSFLGK